MRAVLVGAIAGVMAWPGAAGGHELDEYQRMVATLQPFPNTGDRATLPGRLEYEREREWAEAGVPVAPARDLAAGGPTRAHRTPRRRCAFPA